MPRQTNGLAVSRARRRIMTRDNPVGVSDLSLKLELEFDALAVFDGAPIHEVCGDDIFNSQSKGLEDRHIG